METISYKLEHFEGPLDLLLHLIEKNKINIYDIPIVEITAQYLDYVRHMEREDLNIVSELVMRLLEYKKYRLMADELADREDGALKHLYKPSTLPPEVAKYEPPVDLDKLLDGLTLAKLQRIFEQVMKRKEDKIDPIRSNFGTIHREPVSLEQKIGNVLLYARRKRRFSFRELLEGQLDKLEVVVTFLAVLELMKIGKIHLSQEETFGDMDIETLEQEGEEEELDLAQLGDFEG